jgi:hypothetical protein
MKDFLIQSLAAWRLTALLSYEEGPEGAFYVLRAVSKRLGGPLHCFWCTSVWAAAIVLIIVRKPSVVKWLALSAAAVFLEEAKAKLVI